MSTEISAAVRSLLEHQPHVGQDCCWDESAGVAALKVLSDAGWLGVGLAIDLDGEGGEFADAVAVVEAVSAVGWPSPVADVVLVANSLRAVAGIPAGASGLALVVPEVGTIDDAGLVRVQSTWVPWASWADELLVIATDSAGGTVIAVVDANRAQLLPRRSLSGAPAAGLTLYDAPAKTIARVPRPANEVADDVLCCGALARSVQMASALGRVQELTLAHTAIRRQFGRPLSAFQAVQQNVAVLAGAVVAAQTAVTDAVRGMTNPVGLRNNPRLATAKIQACIAATDVARIAHQLHGAVGTAREHELHRHTLALWSWREEFGAEHLWARRLAEEAMTAPDLWAWLTEVAPDHAGDR